MKDYISILLILLLLTPTVQAHTDVVITGSEVAEHALEELVNPHQEAHHENDSEEDKNMEHHHHCSIISVSPVFVKNDFQYHFSTFSIQKEKILFSKNLYSSSYLDRLFQPPQA